MHKHDPSPSLSVSSKQSNYQSPSLSDSSRQSSLPSPSLSINTKTKLNELLGSFPQWNDATLVRSLFAPLPSPTVKPEAFEQKYTFWHDILLSVIRNGLLGEGRVFCLSSTAQLGPKYFSNHGVGGLYPICLPGVLKEMQRRQIALESLSDLNKSRRQSWISRLLFGEAKSEVEDDSIEESIPASLILLPLLNEQRLLLQDMPQHPASLPLTLDEFKSLINTTREQREGLAPISHPSDWSLLLEYLQQQGVLVYAKDKDRFAIKLGKSVINQVDWDILRVKEASFNINAQLMRLTSLASNLRSQQALERARGDIQAAAFTRQRLNRLDSFITQRMNSLGNLDTLMTRIEGAGDDVAVLAAYRSGSAALQQMLSQMGDVEQVMDELADLNERAQEIGQVVTSNNKEAEETDISDLERELQDLIVSEPDSESNEAVDSSRREVAVKEGNVQEKRDVKEQREIQREALLNTQREALLE